MAEGRRLVPKDGQVRRPETEASHVRLAECCVYAAISVSLVVRSRALIAASRRKAAPLESTASVYRRTSGLRCLVYLAPLPAACADILFAKSLVTPV